MIFIFKQRIISFRFFCRYLKLYFENYLSLNPNKMLGLFIFKKDFVLLLLFLNRFYLLFYSKKENWHKIFTITGLKNEIDYCRETFLAIQNSMNTLKPRGHKDKI